MKYNRVGWLFFAVMATGLVGCGDAFGELDFSFRSVPPVPVTINYDEIRIPQGIGVGVIARPLNDDGEEMDEDTEVVLESKNPGVLVVGPSQPNQFEEDDEDKQNWTFVFFGAAEGTADVTVRIKGDVAGRIPARVDAQ